MKFNPLIMIGLLIVVFYLAAYMKPTGTESILGTASKWRILSYPTWTPDIAQYQFDIFNVFFHFNIEPTATGDISIANIPNATAKAFIQKAHLNNDMAFVVIGGEGYGTQFTGATNTANRAKFVQQLTTYVHNIGYDGLVMDWEESVNNANLVQTMKDLRASFNAQSPKPMLLIDVCCEVTLDTMGQVAPYVDSINTMDYSEGLSHTTDLADMIAVGVPTSKIINGMGFYDYVNTQARSSEQVNYTIANNLKGIEIWDSSEMTSAADVRLIPIQALLGNTQAIGGTINTPSCNTAADTDCNGHVLLLELSSYTSLWKQGSVSLSQLAAATSAWKAG